jgi:hypothetical protein
LNTSCVLRLAGRIHPLTKFPAPIFLELMNMDISSKTIKELFFKQIRDLTLKSKIESFDFQFSDRWL